MVWEGGRRSAFVSCLYRACDDLLNPCYLRCEAPPPLASGSFNGLSMRRTEASTSSNAGAAPKIIADVLT